MQISPNFSGPLAQNYGSDPEKLRGAKMDGMDILHQICLQSLVEIEKEWHFLFLSHDGFVRTNRRAIAMMFVRLSVCLSVRLGQACIMMIRCMFSADSRLDSQCSGQSDTKACPPTPSRHFPFPPGREVWYRRTGWNQGQGTYTVVLIRVPETVLQVKETGQ